MSTCPKITLAIEFIKPKPFHASRTEGIGGIICGLISVKGTGAMRIKWA